MYARDGRVEATKGVPFGFAASFVVAEHLTFKLRRLGRRVRTIRSSGFGLPDDLLGIERGDVVLIAPHSPTGLTGDAATAMVLADALIQGVAAADVENTVEYSHTLNTLRQQMGF